MKILVEWPAVDQRASMVHPKGFPTNSYTISMQIVLQQLNKELSVTWVQGLTLALAHASSSEAGYHHRLMIRYQQPEMCVKKLQRDAQKISIATKSRGLWGPWYRGSSI
jgi:hypothetical protein